MRDYESTLRISKRYLVNVNWIGKAHIKRRRQTERLSNADAQHSAMYEGDRARAIRQKIQQRGDSVILDRVAMHRRKETQAVDMPAPEGTLDVSGRRRRHRIHHHVSIKSLRKRAHRGDDRFLIARHARDQACSADALTIQLLNP